MAILAPIAGVAGGGGIFGNLALAALSFGASLALAYFFPQKVRGPRAENLKAQTSRYGDHIARTYGTVKIAGAVIWLKNDQVDEHQHTSRAGKALGPEVTEFSYTADFAVVFTWNGPVRAIPRIWADDKLIYDQSAESLEFGSGEEPAGGVVKGADIEIFLGTDDQLPSPHIVADRGASSAYRGLCGAVIRNLPLDEFGIRVPNIEAEVVRGGTDAMPGIDTTAIPDASPYHVDIKGRIVVGAGGSNNSFAIYSLPDPDPVFVSANGINPNVVHITDRGEIMVSNQETSAVHFHDANTGALIETVGGLGGTSGENALADDVTVAGVTYLLVWRWSGWLSLITNDGTGNVLAWSQATTYEPLSDIETMSVSPTRLYGIHDTSANIEVIEWDPVLGILSETTVSLAADLGANEAVICHYDDESDSVIVLDEAGNIYVYDADLTTLLRSRAPPSGMNLTGVGDPLASKRLKSGSDRIAVKGASNNVWEFRVSTLEQVNFVDHDATDWPNKSTSGYSYFAFDEEMRALITVGFTGTRPAVVWFMPRARRGGEPLADVIAAECALAGIECDVSEITGEVLGYAVRDGASPRGVLEDLARVEFFDFAHVDGVTKFFPRAAASVRTLQLREMGMAKGDGEPIEVKEEYPDAGELVKGVVLRYQAWDSTYRQSAQAVSSPAGLDDQLGVLELDTNLVMTDQDAARAADIIFNETRDAPKIYRTNLGPKHLDLHPGDVVSIPLDTARTVKGALAKMAGEAVLEMEFRHRGSEFTSEAEPNPTPPWTPPNLAGRARSIFLPIDGHLLRAADDDDSFYSGVYKRERGSFRSATVYRSTDGGDTYRPWASFANAAVRGIAAAALPDRPHPHSFDRATELVVWVPFGRFPESVTEDELLADETLNGFAIKSGTEWEYARAANVVDNGDGSYTLSSWLRGQKGTEFAMADHAVGDAVVYLDASALHRPGEGDRTLSRIYVAVSTGIAFDSTNAVTFQNMGKGLRPWAPVNLRATRDGSGNLSGTFNRRDRLGQAWPDDGPEDPPMSEDAESYEIRIYDTDGETVLRTITSSTEDWDYSAADQTTDFGAPQAEGTIDHGIVQVSATYGDGIEARAML